VLGIDGAMAIAGQGSDFSCAALLGTSVLGCGALTGVIDADCCHASLIMGFRRHRGRGAMVRSSPT
jgi:hypothetical protein